MTSPHLAGRVEAAEGRSGRLFVWRAGEHCARSLYAEPWTDDARLLRLWSAPMARLSALARELGARLLVLNPPDAHDVHAADLPEGWRVARPTVGDRFAHLFCGEVETLPLGPTLHAARGALDPWRLTDSHWSAAGAYAAYRLLMDHLHGCGAHVVQPDDFTLVWTEEAGDLGAGCDPPLRAPTLRTVLAAPRACVVRDACNHRRHALKVFEVDDPTLPTCVMLRDSFATELAPFLTESFRRTVLVGAEARGFPDLIRHERPDVILFERAERALPGGVVDWDLTGWREHWPVPGDGSHEAEAARAERDAARALEAGAPSQAEARAQAAVAWGDTPDRRLLLGRAQLARGRAGDAAEAFGAALAADPARWSFALHLGVARLAQGRTAEACALFARACALAPWHPRPFEHFGYACLALGDPASARPALEQAVALGPEIAGSWLWLLQALERLGDAPALARARTAAAAHVDIASLDA